MVSLTDVNQKLIGAVSVNRSTIINAVGWLLVGLVVIGIGGWLTWAYFEKKKYNKKVKVYVIVNGYFHLNHTDVAKTVKLGKGGFEIIFLRKLKTWKLAHGARTGVNEYAFYILPDGYWYPGQVSANLKYIDKDNGLITVMTTNPTMRSQYTSLEKQIDTLHGEKQTFWDKYGSWVLTGVYIALIGIFSWLSFREVAQFLGSGSELAHTMNDLADKMNQLAVNLNAANNGGGGLVTSP